ncbi:MAG: sn-glycerol-3-phosphate ABC transporter ATP-binding protein UgpC [Pirellulales bacterium]|nr:sn-glycerol-3-phosphate ABC transporter ATP-binding protein UgpC [Pirellulales bacterium]
MATLALENVVKQFAGNVRAVDGLTLDVADGELIVLVGPSGCGKTTTLRMIAGLETLTRGSILIDGRDVGRLRPRDRDVAMVFQHFALYPHLSVAGNLAFGLKLRRTPRAEIQRRVNEAADVLRLGHLLARRPGELSGGERQRVALGRAIVRQPRVFLFDEPLSNLDAALRCQMRQEIRRIHARLETTAVYVTHDQTEAMTLGQRIAVMRDGRLQQVADPATLYRRPANRFVAALLGSPPMNFFDGWIQRSQGKLVFATVGEVSDGDRIDAQLDSGTARHFTLPVPAAWTARVEPYLNRPITLGIRPEHLGSPAAGRSPDVPRIPALVEAVESIGPESHVYLRAGQHTFVCRVEAGRQYGVGDQVAPAVALEMLHFFDPQTQSTVG